MTAKETAVIPATLDADEVQALLSESGMLPVGGSSFRRMTLASGSLVTDQGKADEETWPPVKKGPTMTVRIVKPPVYYSAFWLGVPKPGEAERSASFDATALGHPEWNGRFVKRYDSPEEQAADEFSNLAIYEEVATASGKRGAFKADIQLQIVPDSGEMTGEEPVYTLTLSTTAALDFRGSSSNINGGIVQDKNFIVQLGELAAKQAAEAGGDKATQSKAVLDAMTGLRLGAVVAEIYLIMTQSQTDPSIKWTVPAFVPIHIEPLSEAPALAAGDNLTGNSDDIGF